MDCLCITTILIMLRPRQTKKWGNKANSLTTKANSQKQAWSNFLVSSNSHEVQAPTFDEVFEIKKI